MVADREMALVVILLIRKNKCFIKMNIQDLSTPYRTWIICLIMSIIKKMDRSSTLLDISTDIHENVRWNQKQISMVILTFSHECIETNERRLSIFATNTQNCRPTSVSECLWWSDKWNHSLSVDRTFARVCDKRSITLRTYSRNSWFHELRKCGANLISRVLTQRVDIANLMVPPFSKFIEPFTHVIDSVHEWKSVQSH
jgi:hypothetical protein